MTSGTPSSTLQHRHPVSNLKWRGRKLLASQQALVWRRRRSIRARNFLNAPGSSKGCSGARLPPIGSRGLHRLDSVMAEGSKGGETGPRRTPLLGSAYTPRFAHRGECLSEPAASGFGGCLCDRSASSLPLKSFSVASDTAMEFTELPDALTGSEGAQADGSSRRKQGARS